MNCKNHKDIPSTHITQSGNIPLCDDCTVAAREHGFIVRKHRGFLWGYPIVVQDDDGVLDARVIGESVE